MAYFIRKGNLVYGGYREGDFQWDQITSTTRGLVVMVFTTKADAKNEIWKYSDIAQTDEFTGAIITNDLDYVQ